MLFFVTTLLILAAGRQLGLTGAVIIVALMCLLYVAAQWRLVALLTGCRSRDDFEKVSQSLDRIGSWNLNRLPVNVVENVDPGFTGGVVGLPGFESIVIPKGFFYELSVDQLAVVLARRMIAVDSGSRTRGIVLAVGWIVVGFFLATLVPGAGVASVAELTMTSMAFTIWTFIGLLTLPTVSRQSSYAIDAELLRLGADSESFAESITS
ncbi:MAG: hypothetical protein AAF664_12210 [Planctomycetota bacterium]